MFVSTSSKASSSSEQAPGDLESSIEELLDEEISELWLDARCANFDIGESSASRGGNKVSSSTRNPKPDQYLLVDDQPPPFIISLPKSELRARRGTPEEVIIDVYQKLLHRDPSVPSRGLLEVQLPPQVDAFYYDKKLPPEQTRDRTKIDPSGPQSGVIWWIGDGEFGTLQVNCPIRGIDEAMRRQHRVLKFTLVRQPLARPTPSGAEISEDDVVSEGNKVFKGLTTFIGDAVFKSKVHFHTPPITQGADYAEYLPLANASEDVRAGEVVEALGGVISKNITYTAGARYFVISDVPSLCGNFQENAEDQKRMRQVALLGQVRVFVQGEVEDNAFLVPAGEGLARALTREEVEADPSVIGRCLGMVWKHAEAPSLSMGAEKDHESVIAFVSGGGSDACSLSMAALAQRLYALERQLSALNHCLPLEAASDDASSSLQPLMATVVRGTCERMASTWPPDWLKLSQLTPKVSEQHSLASTLLVLLGWVSAVDEAIEEPAAEKARRATVDSIAMDELAAIFERLGEDSKDYQILLGLWAQQLPAEKVKDLATEAIQKATEERDPQGKTHSRGRWFGDLLKQNIKQRQAEDSATNPTLPAEPPPSRGYQVELFEKAKDSDVILVTPPGTGKTHVSAKVIEHVLKRCKDKVCVYLEKNRNLVQQQKEELDKYFKLTFEGWDEDFAGAYVGGEFIPEWEELTRLHRVLLLTPQLLVDRLDMGKARLGDVALLVLDECHDAKNNHSYNNIMRHYKEMRATPDGCALPQILGLSATPANADTVESTQVRLDALISNMGGANIIQVTEQSHNLAEHIRLPEATHHLLKPRKDDIDFRWEVRSLMSKIARSFHNKVGVDDDEVKAAMVNVARQLESAGIHDVNTKQLGLDTASGTTLRVDIAKLRGDDAVAAHGRLARNRVAFKLLESLAAAELTVLELGWEIALMDVGVGVAEALDITTLCSEAQEIPACLELTKFVLESGICTRYIKDLLATPRAQPSGAAPSTSTSASPYVSPQTPKLQELKQCLKEHWDDSGSLSCIVFVKERKSAYRIVSYLQKDPSLSFVKPSVFIGRKCMSTKAQDAVRTRFLQGDVNLLVATSVAEEGLNATECSMVVMLDSVPTGQALTQCMGRVRKLRGKFHVFYYPSERKYLLRSEQQQKARSDALRERTERQHAIACHDPLGKLNQMKQRGQLTYSTYYESEKKLNGPLVFLSIVTIQANAVDYRGVGRELQKKAAQNKAAREALSKYYESLLGQP